MSNLRRFADRVRDGGAIHRCSFEPAVTNQELDKTTEQNEKKSRRPVRSCFMPSTHRKSKPSQSCAPTRAQSTADPNGESELAIQLPCPAYSMLHKAVHTALMPIVYELLRPAGCLSTARRLQAAWARRRHVFLNP